MDASAPHWTSSNRNSEEQFFFSSRKFTFFLIFCHFAHSIAYSEMNEMNREQTLRQNFDQLILNIDTYILILQNISNSFDGRVGWKEFKFCFKLAASQMVSTATIKSNEINQFELSFSSLISIHSTNLERHLGQFIKSQIRLEPSNYACKPVTILLMY